MDDITKLSQNEQELIKNEQEMKIMKTQFIKNKKEFTENKKELTENKKELIKNKIKLIKNIEGSDTYYFKDFVVHLKDLIVTIIPFIVLENFITNLELSIININLAMILFFTFGLLPCLYGLNIAWNVQSSLYKYMLYSITLIISVFGIYVAYETININFESKVENSKIQHIHL